MRLVMMGTGSFAEPTFEAILQSSHEVVGLVTQPDKPTGKERGSTRQARRGMKELALERGIPMLQPESINTTEGVRSLQEWQPDLLVVAAYGQILSKDVLAVAPQGGINIHASLLPKYRGAAPIAWTIYHGEKQTGVTIIKMSIYLDAGDMVAQEAVEIGPEETAGELEGRLGPLGAKLALQVIERMTMGPVTGTKQDKSQATKAPKLVKEFGLIDWARTPLEVCNQIRAMQPWPTAYTFLHDKNSSPLRLIILRARPAMETIAFPSSQAGSMASDGNHFWVRTGAEGAIEIVELQPAGKRRMEAREFLRGHPLTPESRLGAEKILA
jgi:methionyl-tRNA formyltransferase